MKTYLIASLMLVAGLGFGQDPKHKARLSVQYTKIMNLETFIAVSAKYKGKSGIEPASGLELEIYKKVSEDSLSHLGRVVTDAQGKAKFVLMENRKDNTMEPHVTGYIVKIENAPGFEDAEKEISIADAGLSASIEAVDSVNRLTATLLDPLGRPLAGQPLKVQLQRMYAPLQIGEESYETDENGSITVPITEPMPGVNGDLTFEVILAESDTYGTLKALVSARIGTPITDRSTFDQRTMWSPPSKTPYYLLLFPNLIILGVWIPIVVLLVNLFRIFKN